ncbi:MAG: CBS domain-containing protein [Methanoregulaceae archaeon]|nr:CBS domain-containing protein [Methanoregulaceae archaeon]
MSGELYIRDVMSKPVTIAKSALLTEALDKMIDEGIDPLIVVHNNSVVGTVSRMAIAETLGTRKNSSVSATSIHVANSVEEDFTTVYPDQDLDVLVPLLQHYKLIVVYDSEHRLIGQVTGADLLRKYDPSGSLADVMEPGCTIDVEERVVHLRRRMIDDGISRFIVTENDQAIGIVTETDVAVAMRRFREIVEGRHQENRVRNLLVKDIMSSPIIMVGSDAKLPDVVRLMIDKKISAIPIADNGRLCGVVTRAGLIKAL